MSKHYPFISDELIEYLDEAFPDRAAAPQETLDEIRHHGGQVSVVRHLKFIKKQQEENVLENS